MLGGVSECLASVLDIDPSMIREDSRVIEDLGADSLDLLDLLFQLERRFQIKISPRGIERRAQEMLGDFPLEVNGVYTPQALEQLRRSLPEVPAAELADGLEVADLPRRFRTATFVRLVTSHLESPDRGQATDPGESR